MKVARVALSAAGVDQQKAAPLGLFVLLLLGVACYFLFKSMSRHLKRVREDFPVGSGAATTGTASTRTAITTTTSTPTTSASMVRPAGEVSRPAKPEPSSAEGSAEIEHRRSH